MARRTKEEAQATRESILDAALDVLSEKGYSNTTFTAIARRIGMTKGAVYWHFKDKPSLLAALIHTMHEREHALLTEYLHEEMTLANLKDYLVARVHIVTNDGQCRKFVIFVLLQMEWSAEVITAVREELTHIRMGPFDELDRLLEQAERRGELRKGVDYRTAKDLLMGLWMGILMGHFQGLSTTDPVQTAETGLSLLIDAIKA